MLTELDYHELFDQGAPVKIPFYSSLVSAGFPSPADDFIEKRLDIHDLVQRKNSTYFFRVQGESMQPTIQDGDIVVVDSAVTPQNHQIVVASLDGQFTIKRLIKTNGKVLLRPDNKGYEEIEITEFVTFKIWGVCTFAIHDLKK